MRKSVFIPLVGFLALISAAVSPAAAQSGTPAGAKPHAGTPASAHPGASVPQRAAGPVSASGSFTVSQFGHAVGTAEFRITPSAAGYDSTSTVRVSMQGLDYALSKTEQLDQAHHLAHVVLSATVNNQAVNITAKPDAGQFLLNISANGRSSTSRLASHPTAVIVPDFDPGAQQTLLTLADAQNGRDLWVIIPKEAGTIDAVQVATYADEHGTLDGKPITVHHVVTTVAQADTDLFFGAGNQLLQAELPQQGFSLIRKGFVLTPPKRPGAAPQPPPQQ